MVKFICCLLLCLSCCVNVYAVSAYPHKVIVQTVDGENVAIYMKGDEYHKFAVTEDGYTLISDSVGWWYAKQLEDGGICKSTFKLMSIENETHEIKRFKSNVSKGIVPMSMVQMQPNRSIRRSRSTPLVGERRALVILMQYKDLAFKKSKEDFEILFNTIGYQENGATGSVRDFYSFASQGQLDYVSDVYGPYTSVYPMKYYGGNGVYGNDSNPMELCVEAMRNLPADFDYTRYDNDGDGLIDNVHIIFAGYGEEAGASSDAIWAHEYSSQITMANYSVAGYSCSPELRDNQGYNITNIGVICHELGHALGAMDYYDTNSMTGGEYTGTGQWDIMAEGSWNDNGRTPPNFNPYVRSVIFGWNEQVALMSNQQIVMPRMESDNFAHSVIYRLETESNGDYFLLENRQKYRFDAALPGEGLVIYHVHPSIESYANTNAINATHPQGLYPVCASYSEPSKKEYGNINSAECTFPGSDNVREFSHESSPAAFAWNGSKAKVSIYNITNDSDEGEVSFETGGFENSDTMDIPIDMELVYSESFETDDTTDRIFVNSITGNESWRVYKKGDFVINPELIPEPIDGEKILMLYSGKASSVSESEALSQYIDVVSGESYVVSFDICCKTSSTFTPCFDLFVVEESGEYSIYSKNEVINKWESVTIPIVFSGEKFSYKLSGSINMGGIFIDNIKLYKKDNETSISPVKFYLDTEADGYIYQLNGICVGRFSVIKNNLPKGFYLVHQGEGVHKFIVK